MISTFGILEQYGPLVVWGLLIEWSRSSRVCLYIKVDLTTFMSFSRISLTRKPKSQLKFSSFSHSKRLKTPTGLFLWNFLFLLCTPQWSLHQLTSEFRRHLENSLQVVFFLVTLISQQLEGKSLDSLPSYFRDFYFFDTLQTRTFELVQGGMAL